MPINPDKLLLKVPKPFPSEVLLSVIVGLPRLFQHTPLKVIDAAPSFEIIPPLIAVVCVIKLKGCVIITGIVAGSVVNDFTFP